MRFRLIDRVLEVSGSDGGGPTRAVAIKHVSAAEEYLQDHFAGFPILPGVFMLEALVQTAREVALARGAGQAAPATWVLGAARAVKYGRFVPPGSTLRLEVDLVGASAESLEFKGIGLIIEPIAGGGDESATAVSGKFSLRPARPGG